VTEYENTIKRLSSEVFDTLGVQDEGRTLDVAVKGLDWFQGDLKSLMDALVKQVQLYKHPSNKIIDIVVTMITVDDYRGDDATSCDANTIKYCVRPAYLW